jgi:O-acetyl-ADP-ribose deacetylase (regulator of RNase III)
MSDNTADPHAKWKIRPVAFLLPHLKGNEAERHSVVNAVLMALDTAHAEGIRHAAHFCRTVGTGAQQHGEAATTLADVLETIAERVEAEAGDAARRWQDEP